MLTYDLDLLIIFPSLIGSKHKVLSLIIRDLEVCFINSRRFLITRSEKEASVREAVLVGGSH